MKESFFTTSQKKERFDELSVFDYLALFVLYVSFQQALNIIPLKANVTKVEKLGARTFIVSLAHSKKTFR